MKIDGIQGEPEGERNVWTEIHRLREACELFLDFPAPDPDAENADREDDERVIRQQVVGATDILQCALNLLAAHVNSLYGGLRGGDLE
jgi:hypothetical protein